MFNSKNLITFLLPLIISINYQLVQSKCSQDKKTFNVLNYGAIGDGSSDDTQAFSHAWEDACKFIGSQSTIQIPPGKSFLLQPIEFHGPCKSNKIFFSLNRNLTAPLNPNEWNCKIDQCHKWIEFAHISGLYIDGHGTIDGRGQKWWSLDCIKYKSACLARPKAVIISHSDNVHISNINLKDSPNFQMSFEDLKWVIARKLTITADGHSPNTDGIHIQRCQNVLVHNSVIGTGDDCISIGEGSKYINISRISCGPGHGISIGSLGQHGSTEVVENIFVRDCIFRETDNGVRIKTWQGGKGHVQNVLFEHIKLYGATRPIIIDQFYCPHTQCQNHTEAVEIKNVVYNHIHGTAIKRPFVQLLCSNSVPCKDIFMNNINIHDLSDFDIEGEGEEDYCRRKRSRHDQSPAAECMNVRGEYDGVMMPKLACLSPKRY